MKEKNTYNPLIQVAIILLGLGGGGYFFWNAFVHGSVTFGTKSGDFTWSGRPASVLGYTISLAFFALCIKEIRELAISFRQKSAGVSTSRQRKKNPRNDRGN